MNKTTLLLAVFSAFTLLFGSACKKSDSTTSPTPTNNYGSITFNGKNVTVSNVTIVDDPRIYQMMARGQSGSDYYTLTYQLSSGKPTTNGTVRPGAAQLFLLVANGSGGSTYYYAKSDENVNNQLNSGRLTISASNLTQTSSNGTVIGGGKPVTFTVTEP